MKLAANGTRFGAGQAIVTPAIIEAEMIAQYNLMELEGQVQDTAAFAAGLIVQLNATDPSRADALLDPVLVSGLRIFAALTQFYLNNATVLAAASSSLAT
jgi:phage tail sheath gpL-like